MLRNRIILLITGISLSVILFSLPKVVVDNEEEELSTPSVETVEGHNPNDSGFDHEQAIDSSILRGINSLRELLLSSDSNEKSTIFADSLGSLFQSVGKFDSSAYYFEWLAERFPNEENMTNAGLAYYEAFGYAVDDNNAQALGNKARSYLNKILAKHPERLDLKTKIAMTYVSTSNPMRGIMMLREVVEKDPDHQEAIFNLGLLSRQSGQTEKAKERFEHLIVLNPDNLQARFLLGMTYMDLGQKNKAKEQFEIVKRTGNDPAITATVNAYLEEIN